MAPEFVLKKLTRPLVTSKILIATPSLRPTPLEELTGSLVTHLYAQNSEQVATKFLVVYRPNRSMPLAIVIQTYQSNFLYSQNC